MKTKSSQQEQKEKSAFTLPFVMLAAFGWISKVKHQKIKIST